MKKTKNENKEDINKRLDALIRILIELTKRMNKKFNEKMAANVLKSVGLTPTEIAKILGKKSASNVAPYLYSKKKSERG
ncbi:MAG: hypothetical protein QXM11_02015 [Candidatus Aenigmatarchaeota archaeon]